jgi:predicted nucleic acid-binding protein
MSCRRLVFDTGPLCSFAVVSRLDLLEAICAGHGSWPLSVQRELRAGARTLPALGRAHEVTFLGLPEVLERPADILEAELLRVRLAGSSLGQRRNLGEAEAIFLARRRGGVLVSEDRDARVLAASELGPGRAASTPDRSPARSGWGWSRSRMPGSFTGRWSPPGGGPGDSTPDCSAARCADP